MRQRLALFLLIQGPTVMFSRQSFFSPILTGTHAHLSTKHTGFEERVYNISIRISEGGRQPMEGTVSLPGRYFAAGNLG